MLFKFKKIWLLHLCFSTNALMHCRGQKYSSFAGFSFTGNKEKNNYNNNSKLDSCLQSVWVFIKYRFAHKKCATELGSILSKALINLDNWGRGCFCCCCCFVFIFHHPGISPPLYQHQCFTGSAPGWWGLPSSYTDNKIHRTILLTFIFGVFHLSFWGLQMVKSDQPPPKLTFNLPRLLFLLDVFPGNYW